MIIYNFIYKLYFIFNNFKNNKILNKMEGQERENNSIMDFMNNRNIFTS